MIFPSGFSFATAGSGPSHRDWRGLVLVAPECPAHHEKTCNLPSCLEFSADATAESATERIRYNHGEKLNETFL